MNPLYLHFVGRRHFAFSPAKKKKNHFTVLKFNPTESRMSLDLAFSPFSHLLEMDYKKKESHSSTINSENQTI